MLTLLLALTLDLALGDPPSRWHPVAWVGRALDAGRHRLSGARPGVLLVGGAALVIGLAGGAAAVALTLERVVSPWPLVALLVDAALLKGALSARGLFAAVSGVRRALEAGRLEGARAALGRDLVSRPVESLDAGHVASGAIESLAENLTDAQARSLAQEGKSVVWIDGGLHATEVLGAQQLIQTVYELVSRTERCIG